MTVVLGISGGFTWGLADASATLIVDGEVVAACEEERFDRSKGGRHRIPTNAIRFALASQALTIDAVDVLAYNNDTYRHFEEDLRCFLRHEFGNLPRAMQPVNHHLAHAASGYYASGLDHVAILTFDFSGDGVCTSLYEGRKGEIRRIESVPTASGQSLGKYYVAMTQALGYGFGDEFKVMGLSAYGDPADMYDLDRIIKADDTGFTISADAYHQREVSSLRQPLFNRELFEKIGLPLRISGELINDNHEKLAQSAQSCFETATLSIARRLRTLTDADSLILTGGCALNCAANGVLSRSGLFKRIYVPPVASDAGGSLGAAYTASRDRGDRPRPLETALLGPMFDAEECALWLERLGVAGERLENPAHQAAKDIACGKLVSWFQGKSEFGPRALGSRSILANPCDATVKDRINQSIKFRESYRPFAPSVLLERSPEYFDHSDASPYMTIAHRVLKPELLPAITHVDGSARVQTVDRHPGSAMYRNLLSHAENEFGVPVVLNTSFNIDGQPIVNTPQEAIYTFFATGLDVLYLGPFRVAKSER